MRGYIRRYTSGSFRVALVSLAIWGGVLLDLTGPTSSHASDYVRILASGQPADTPVNFTVSGSVPKLKQPTSMTCWATAATIMRSWKDNVPYKIPDVMAKAGADYEQKFKNDQGMLGAEKSLFLQALVLKSEPPQSYTIAGWLALLKAHGPLWVTTDEDPSKRFSIHARILKGIQGDGSPDLTFMTLIDPATGTQTSESVAVFTKKFEDVAKADQATDLRPQVVHY